MMLTGDDGDCGVKETTHIPFERVHCGGEKPAGDRPPGPGAFHETTPVATMPFKLSTLALHVSLEPKATDESRQ
jgi:hypothetical protein